MCSIVCVRIFIYFISDSSDFVMCDLLSAFSSVTCWWIAKYIT